MLLSSFAWAVVNGFSSSSSSSKRGCFDGFGLVLVEGGSSQLEGHPPGEVGNDVGSVFWIEVGCSSLVKEMAVYNMASC